MAERQPHQVAPDHTNQGEYLFRNVNTFALPDAAGVADEQVLVRGMPVGDVQPGSAVGTTPCAPSPLIADADGAAG